MYTIIDLETTGGKFNEESIIEVAAYKFDGVNITDQFISLVNPQKDIHQSDLRLIQIKVGFQEFQNDFQIQLIVE